MKSKKTKFILAIALQIAIILTIVIFKTVILSSGTEVLLKIEPVDPRTPLRGDYLDFRYEISSLSPHLFTYQPIKQGNKIYIPLEKRGKFWQADYGITKHQPENTDQVFIEGEVSRVSGSQINVVYGIEQYFIPEGTGRQVSFWNREAYAKVAISKKGDTVLKQVYLDDKPWP